MFITSNLRYYLILNQGNSLATCSSTLASQVARFEVDGQRLEIVEAENSPNLNSDIAAILTGRELQIATFVAVGFPLVI
ncbi:hypothetical protein [Microseira wollei]|uniref:hypothetical protein n=1 Tax=Microseira wollei TaxID=467598 RepID=UPI001CFD81D7|nr:hypothetical protein [Microseira wollei]